MKRLSDSMKNEWTRIIRENKQRDREIERERRREREDGKKDRWVALVQVELWTRKIKLARKEWKANHGQKEKSWYTVVNSIKIANHFSIGIRWDIHLSLSLSLVASAEKSSAIWHKSEPLFNQTLGCTLQMRNSVVCDKLIWTQNSHGPHKSSWKNKSSYVSIHLTSL